MVLYLYNIWWIALIFLIAYLIILWRKSASVFHIILITVFWFYIMAVANATLFPIPFSEASLKEMLGKAYYFPPINIIPFYFGTSAYSRMILYGIVGNIFLTIPFGFGLSFVTAIKKRSFLWLPFVVGLGIELTQLLISLIIGFFYRVIDINDVLMNALGVWVGYILFRLFAAIAGCVIKKFNIEKFKVSLYLLKIINRSK